VRDQGSALPARFIAELGQVFERVSENPMQFPLVEEWVRRALLAKFPYSVYFTTEHASNAMVLAVVHQKPHPSHWKRPR
jgi:plasmid stabilization system protein ParE